MQGAPPFQASSIHTRRFYAPSIAGTTRPSSPGDTIAGGGAGTNVPGPATLPVVSPTSTALPLSSGKNAREQRLMSDLWLMSSATFRRMGKIEQCRGAIQEAEVADENNPAVWVQVCFTGFRMNLLAHNMLFSSLACTSQPWATTAEQRIQSTRHSSLPQTTFLRFFTSAVCTSHKQRLRNVRPCPLPMPSPSVVVEVIRARSTLRQAC
jgi:hypothetical protein